MSKTPTRFSNGVTNVGPTSPFYKLGILFPGAWQTFFDDFNSFRPDEWTATEVDTDADGAAARTIDATEGGVLNILNNDNALDSTNLRLGDTGSEQFLLTAGKQAIIGAKFSSTDVDKTFLAIGLIEGADVDLEGGLPNDHVVIKVDAADANIDVSVSKDGTATTETAVGTLADYVEGTNNLTEVVLYYNGDDKIEVFVDGDKVATMVTDNWPDDEELGLAIEVHNSDAAADAMALDWLIVAVER